MRFENWFKESLERFTETKLLSERAHQSRGCDGKTVTFGFMPDLWKSHKDPPEDPELQTGI